jgi:HSP20 family protein
MKEDLWMPAIDIEEKDGTIEVKAELPGMKKDDIKVTIHDNMLTLSGERRHEKETDHQTFHRVERAYGKFIRTIALPVPVSADKIKAQYRDGVLQVTLPKPEALKPADIKIEAN